jgi:two-component system chemotaxis sensor kinase CheA
MDLDEIQAIFFQECDEGLAMMESHFAALRDGGDDETINTIFRAVHSIKGGAGAFGHELLQTFTHHYETVLDKVRDGELKLTPDLISTIMMAFDMLADHVAAARGEGSFPDDAAVLARLEGALGGGHAAAPVVEAAPVAAPAPVAAVEPAPAAAIIDTDVDDLLGMFDDSPKAAAAAAPVAAKDDFDDFSFDDLPSSEEPAPEAEPAAWVVRFRPGAGGLDNGGEPLLLLREMTLIGGTSRSKWTRSRNCHAAGSARARSVLPLLDVRTAGHVSKKPIFATIFEFMDGRRTRASIVPTHGRPRPLPPRRR